MKVWSKIILIDFYLKISLLNLLLLYDEYMFPEDARKITILTQQEWKQQRKYRKLQILIQEKKKLKLLGCGERTSSSFNSYYD